jgi:hypothetical protein
VAILGIYRAISILPYPHVASDMGAITAIIANTITVDITLASSHVHCETRTGIQFGG